MEATVQPIVGGTGERRHRTLEPIFDHLPRVLTRPIASTRPKCFPLWSGYWSWPVAPCTPAEHLPTIRSSQECWCWGRKKYGDCHRLLRPGPCPAWLS